MKIISTADDQKAALEKFEKPDSKELAYSNTKTDVVQKLLEKQDSNV